MRRVCSVASPAVNADDCHLQVQGIEGHVDLKFPFQQLLDHVLDGTLQ